MRGMLGFHMEAFRTLPDSDTCNGDAAIYDLP